MYKRGLEHIPEKLKPEQKKEKLVKADILYNLSMLYNISNNVKKFPICIKYFFASQELLAEAGI